MIGLHLPKMTPGKIALFANVKISDSFIKGCDNGLEMLHVVALCV